MTPENVTNATKIPAEPGIYALIVESEAPTIVEVGSLGSVSLDKGLYVYIGSAKGPGGLRARLRRHMSRDKKIRWHIDYILSSRSTRLRALVHARTEGLRECVLTPQLEKLGLVHVKYKLGSSDCRNCRSHFLRCQDDLTGCLKRVVQAFSEVGLACSVLKL